MERQQKIEPLERTALLGIAVDAIVLATLAILAVLAGEGMVLVAATAVLSFAAGAVATELSDRFGGMPRLGGKAEPGELVDVSNPWIAAFPWLTIPGAGLLVLITGSYAVGVALPALLLGSQLVPLMRR
ncbi:MAG: hypothetical protein OXI55_10310 [Gammaproteobacteria bacterium]|nr:hypothetical protein [Gammaproteobacteria bacterium]